MIKTAYKQTTVGRLSPQMKQMQYLDLEERVEILPDGEFNVKSTLSLLRADHISFLLNYYSQLKQETEEDLDSDLRWLLIDLENLIDRTLTSPDYSSVSNALLYDLLI